MKSKGRIALAKKENLVVSRVGANHPHDGVLEEFRGLVVT